MIPHGERLIPGHSARTQWRCAVKGDGCPRPLPTKMPCELRSLVPRGALSPCSYDLCEGAKISPKTTRVCRAHTKKSHLGFFARKFGRWYESAMLRENFQFMAHGTPSCLVFRSVALR